MTKFLPFIYDDQRYITNQKCFIITGDNLKYKLAFFNSKVASYWLYKNCPELQGGTRELSKIFFENICIPLLSKNQKNILVNLADKIQNAEQQNNLSLPTKYQKQIDKILYEYYNFDMEQINIIENVQ